MIVVVEPHSDDAFLSLGGHIWRWTREGHDVRIVTVYGNEKRLAEAARYAEKVGAEHAAVGLEESNAGGDVDAPVPVVPDLSDLWAEAEHVIGPVGLVHPEHRAVAAALPAWAEHYVDLPYALAIKHADHVQIALAGRPVVSWLRPHGNKWRHADLFRTQATFMFYNRPNLVGTPEVIVQ